MVGSSAVATTSAGAPASIWSARSEDPPNDILTSTSGCVSSNVVSSAANGSRSEAAASTVRVSPSEAVVHPVRTRATTTATPGAGARRGAPVGSFASLDTVPRLSRHAVRGAQERMGS